ncbi:MAG: hypothetical protein HFF15_01275 [Angelakisella sp.]|nr:hypothetical protein [Angelakisella sp.]
MKKPAQNKRLLLAGVICLALAAAVLGPGLWEEYRYNHTKLRAEIIYCYSDTYMMAAELDMDENFGTLFFFNWPEKHGDEKAKRPGSIVVLTGPDSMMCSYPGQYSDVLAVKLVEQREDFIARHYHRLLEKYRDYDCADSSQDDDPALVEKRAENLRIIRNDIKTLPNLNRQEKEGLWYLIVDCNLKHLKT